MPRKRSTRRSTKPDTRRRSARRSTKPDTRRRSDRRRSSRRMEGGVTLFDQLKIDSTKFGNYNQTKELMKERERQALHDAQQEDEFPELNIQLPHDDNQLPHGDDQLMQMVSDELPSPIEYSDGLPSPVQNSDLPEMHELPSPMGPMGEPMGEPLEPMDDVENLAAELSPEILKGIIPVPSEQPPGQLPPMPKPTESLDIDYEEEQRFLAAAAALEEAEKKKSKRKKSGPRIRLTIGKRKGKGKSKNKSKDKSKSKEKSKRKSKGKRSRPGNVGTELARKDKKESDENKNKKQKEALQRQIERDARLKAREGKMRGGASSSLSLGSIPSFSQNSPNQPIPPPMTVDDLLLNQNYLVKLKNEKKQRLEKLFHDEAPLPEPIQDHQAFDLPDPSFSPSSSGPLPEPIQYHQAFDLPDPFPKQISPGEETGLPIEGKHKPFMRELMELNSESSGPNSEKQRLARMKFEKLIHEATQGPNKFKVGSRHHLKPKNQIMKNKRSPFVFGLHPTGEKAAEHKANRMAAMRRLQQKRHNKKMNPTIRYKSRKNIAGKRPRIKGRFVKTNQPVTNQR